MKNWNDIKNGLSMSQRVLDKVVKPESALKNKISNAQSALQIQISKLECTHKKLQDNHDRIFNKIVDAKKARDESKARSYAIELQELRKIKTMIGNAKLSMEQIQLRLNTVSELGDVVVTLSPCMSLIKGLAPSISSLMPGVSSSLQDLTGVLNDVMTTSTFDPESMISNDHMDQDTTAILEEAHAVIEGETISKMPEPPAIFTQIAKEKEFMI
jgi:division protein CdvB (Snf7/Vps24/ESCRT-III family)